jgi:hypothetical protein
VRPGAAQDDERDLAVAVADVGLQPAGDFDRLLDGLSRDREASRHREGGEAGSSEKARSGKQ